MNHIHSINGAEVINASCSDSSAEIDYSYFVFRCLYCLYCSSVVYWVWVSFLPFLYD